MTLEPHVAASGQGRVQNLLEISVQIFGAERADLAGTGVAVRDREGEIVIATCAHVAHDALGKHPRETTDDDDLGVYFQQAHGPVRKEFRARVICCLPAEYDDDVVLLALIDGPAPLAPEQIAVLGRADDSQENKFRSYGFAPVGGMRDFWLDGTIQGPVMPFDANLMGRMIQLNSSSNVGFQPGMSGAAVLDTERNLVVGLVSDRWRSGDDRSDLGWGLNARVLTFDPFNLELRDTPLPRSAKPTPKTDIAQARAATTPNPGMRLQGAPEPLPEWVGRVDMLAALNADWLNPQTQVVGLIGFGGEGKSSLARQWLANLLADPALPQPDGVFWWPFYDRRSIDEFLEAAIVYLGGGRVDPRELPSASIKAQVIGAMLGARRYLFVLDGMEVMQNNEGDDYGLASSNDLRDLLAFFAGPGHNSFCLITSRAPVNDLIADVNYTHRDVERLSVGDGRALLRNLGVTGEDEALDAAVNQWDGHALTLGLIGSLLAKEYGGDIARLDQLPEPTADQTRYERVHRLLRRYDENLTEAEKAFLTLFSAFRTPVKPDSFDKVFRARVEPEEPAEEPGPLARLLGRKPEIGLVVGQTNEWNAAIAGLDDAEFATLLQHLQNYRMLRYNDQTDEYTTHPLIRNHYFTLLSRGAGAAQAHDSIKDYYLENAGNVPYHPSMDDLLPLIEVVYHACRAGAYDEAYRIYRDRIDQRDRWILTNMGAWETDLVLMFEFFPEGDTNQLPAVSEPGDQSWILNETGLCLTSLGRLAEAAPFYERQNTMQLEMEDWHNASLGYQNLAELHIQLGALEEAAAAADESLVLARRAANKRDELNSLRWQGWIAHLRGEMDTTGPAFQQAEALEHEIDSGKQYLYSLRGIQHADYLRRAVAPDYSRRVTEANIEICERNRWADDLSRCHRVLGDLDADAGLFDSARDHYAEAMRIARSNSRLDVLIDILLAQGRWLAQHMNDTGGAISLLNEALGYCMASGYRIYEADCRVGLAWAHWRSGDLVQARAEAESAKSSSADMGYHWGQVDADEVLAVINRESPGG